MSKPCNGFLYPDDPHVGYRPGCPLCELAATRADYAKLWNEPSPRKPTGSVRPTPKSKPTLPCPLLGDDTGTSVECPTCSGVVHLKVFDCSVHGTCTIGRPVKGIACCVGCTDRPR